MQSLRSAKILVRPNAEGFHAYTDKAAESLVQFRSSQQQTTAQLDSQLDRVLGDLMQLSSDNTFAKPVNFVDGNYTSFIVKEDIPGEEYEY